MRGNQPDTDPRFTPTAAGGWQAENPAQGILLRWEADRLHLLPAGGSPHGWRVELGPLRVGRGADLSPAVPRDPVARDAEIRFSGTSPVRREWFENHPAGIWHRISLVTPPPGRAPERPLVLRWEIDTGLRSEPDPGDTGLRFFPRRRNDVLHYQDPVVWDATGREIEACLTSSAGRLEVQISDPDAEYPLFFESRFTGAGNRPAAGGVSRASEVRRAMLQTYIHGVDDRLAGEVLGTDALPHLRDLLMEPEFPRRDNIVAFLAHLDRGESVPALVAFLEDLPAPVATPEEDRALLLVPQAFGHIARRGGHAGLDLLLEITAPGSDGGPLAAAAARGPRPGRLRGDLLARAVRGLAYSCAPAARSRLRENRWDRTRWPGLDRDLMKHSLSARDLFEEYCAPTGKKPGTYPPPAGNLDRPPPAGPPETRTGPPAAGAAEDVPICGQASGSVVGAGFDSNPSVQNTLMTHANHPDLNNPMTDPQMDAVWERADFLVGVASTSEVEDTSCCITFSRNANAQVFGNSGDGLDTIATSQELNQVLNDPVARGKVVRDISWCGGTGTNIIGCAWVGGHGMAMVRMSSVDTEAKLWVHEYGHNVGLTHPTGTENVWRIMYGIIGGSGLTQPECNGYHNPAPGADADLVTTGLCLDFDGDGLRDDLDNCPETANQGQADFDGDDLGDVCDPDDDNDGAEDPSDCNPFNNQVWGIPSEARDLVVALQPGTGNAVLDWVAPTDPGGVPGSILYDTIRSEDPSDFVTVAECVETNDGPDTQAIDSAEGLPVVPVWTGEGDQPSAFYGYSVAGAGDIDADGFREVIVGSILYPNSGSPDGRAFVYFGSSSGPVAGSPWTSFTDQPSSLLGHSVAGVGDVDNDGFDDVAIGAPFYDHPESDEGQVHLYLGSGSGLPPVPDRVLESDLAGARFGHAVSGAGDLNNDGFEDLVVGAPDTGNGGPGRVWIFHGTAAGIGTTPDQVLLGEGNGDQFGYSVAAAGDANGDGFDDLLVGAPFLGNGQAEEGKAYLFPGSAAGVSSTASWSVEGNQANARYGFSVAGAGDVNGDGIADFLVGAPLHDDGEADEGKVFVYHGSGTAISTTAATTLQADQAGAQLGHSVAGAGDVDGDGYRDILAGAPQGGTFGGGQAFVHRGSLAAGILPDPEWTIGATQSGGQLGFAVGGGGSVNGDPFADLIVGAPFYDQGQSDEGIARVFAGPALGQEGPPLLFYLIRAQTSCGQSSVGTDSDGVDRPARNCP